MLPFRRECGAMAMALDDALLEARSTGSIEDCMRFFQFCPSAVTIGRFQSLNREVDVHACRREGVDIVRRPTGGGTVFHHDCGELTFSVVMGQTPKTRTIAGAFEHICAGVVHGLHELGVKAVFSPVNDILIAGKKISGSAQARRKDALLVHGTVMYATSLSSLARFLTVSSTKLKSKGVSSVEKRVTTLELESAPCDLDTVMDAMNRGFASQLGALEERDIPRFILREAQTMHDERYASLQHTETMP